MTTPTRCPLCREHETSVIDAGNYDGEAGCMVALLDCYFCGEVEVYYTQQPDAIVIEDALRVQTE